MRFALTLCIVLSVSNNAAAQDATSPTEAPFAVTTVNAPNVPTAATMPSPPPPPKDARQKTGLSEEDLANKRKGAYVTGLPLVNSDPDKGVGYGVRLYLYQNGQPEDPRFAYTPYLHRVYAQYFRTTLGYQYHTINGDSLNVAGSPYRFRWVAEYEHELLANYYGVGTESMEPLSRPGAHSFSSAEEFEEFNRNSPTFARYTNYEYIKPQLILTLERDIAGGVLRPLVGVSVMKAEIRDFTGHTVSVDDEKGVSSETLLAADARAGKVVGFDGGWNNKVRVGLAYDTRDFEPDPNEGAFHEVGVFLSRRWLGSDFDYERYLVALRQYYSPIPQAADLVLAGRLVYQFSNGDVPFFEMATLPYSDNNVSALGGLRGMRGYKATRFIGPVMAMANLELRWTFWQFKIAGQDFAPILVPFVDAGRVFDRVSQTTLRDWRFSEGLGLRIAWNQATIIMVDYGLSPEGSGLYINFGHIF
jgi:hypothetical protein